MGRTSSRSRESTRRCPVSGSVRELLAGERGRAIAAAADADGSAEYGDSWYLTVRTALIDSAVRQAITDGFTRVINLGAGFDARPYRMDLGADLTWIEVDDEELLAEKAHLLAGAVPRCDLHLSAVDVTDLPALRDVLGRGEPARTLVLSEGLIMYLTPPQADALISALRTAGIGRWCLDFSSAGVAAIMTRRNRSVLRRAPWRFLPADGLRHFEQRGWAPVSEHAIEPLFPAAVRLGRLTSEHARRIAAGPQPDPRKPGTTPFSAVVTLAPVGMPQH